MTHLQPTPLGSDHPDDAGCSRLDARIGTHGRIGTHAEEWHTWAFRRLPTRPVAKVLHLGCGTGKLWTENASRIPDGWDIMVADRSHKLVASATKPMHHLGISTSGLVFDPESIPCDDASFDLVVATHVFRRCRDMKRVLSEIRRVLRPDGCLFAACRTKHRATHLQEVVQSQRRDVAPWYLHAENAFTLENGRDVLLQAFSDIRVHVYMDSLVFSDGLEFVRYLRTSTENARRVLDYDLATRIVRAVDESILKDGLYHIPNSCGLFEARI